MIAKDFKLDRDGDLYINPNTGDFEIASSDAQHIKDIINANIGWYKQFPLVGVGIINYVKSSGQEQKLEKEIKLQLTADGYSANKPKITSNPNGSMIIEPNAERL